MAILFGFVLYCGAVTAILVCSFYLDRVIERVDRLEGPVQHLYGQALISEHVKETQEFAKNFKAGQDQYEQMLRDHHCMWRQIVDSETLRSNPPKLDPNTGEQMFDRLMSMPDNGEEKPPLGSRMGAAEAMAVAKEESNEQQTRDEG